MSISVAIVDDISRNRNLLWERIGTDASLSLLFTAADGTGFLQQAKEKGAPDVVLMDIEMPGMNGIDTVRLASDLYPQTRFIMLTVFDDEDKIFAAIRAGACGYLLKDDSLLSITDAILQAVEQGGAPMSPGIARKALSLLSQATVEKKTELVNPPAISDRELEILKLLVAGDDYKAIANKLFISPNTVRKHIGNIYQKLHVNSKLQAARLAIKNRWV